MAIFSTIHDFRKAGTLSKQQLPYQDPTYLGFLLLFQYQDIPTNGKGQNLTHGSGATPYSPLFDAMGAEYYLENLSKISGEPGVKFTRKLNALRNFKKALTKINAEMPWYWQTLGGLEKLQQINPLDPYIGGDDSKIAIGCLESVNMAITGLMRLYKEAVFDEEKWTYVVPPNLRKFSVTIYVTEIRDLRMHGAIKETGADSTTSANSTPPKPGEILKQGFKKIFASGNEPKAGEKTKSTISHEYDPNESLVGENSKPFFAFHLSNCEFDITSGTTAFESLTNASPEASSQLISFNYERLWQVDSNSLNGIIGDVQMQDVSKNGLVAPVNTRTVGENQFELTGNKDSKFKNAVDAASRRGAQDLVNLAEKKKQEAISSVSNSVRDSTGIPFSMDGMKPKLELEGVYQNFVNKVDQATNIQRLTSKALSNIILGNVYFEPGQTIGASLNNAVTRALGNIYKG